MRVATKRLSILLSLAVLILVSLVTPGGCGTLAPETDLTELSLEELLAVEVTTFSRKSESLWETTAAVYVITAEDLTRSGVRSLPEALRLAPGMQVAMVDANKWVVSARGFSGLFANKLLVLIDGRSVYTPLFSGVFWEAQDVVLEDVDRIEVIRGPGGTLWGANAVNGIINVITKKSEETQGGFVHTGGGTEERGFVTVRMGGQLGTNSNFRVYGKYFSRDASDGLGLADRADDWRVFRAGARFDHRKDLNRLTIQGDMYTGRIGHFITAVTGLTPPYQELVLSDAEIHGGNLLARWNSRLGARSDLSVQAYVDRTTRKEQFLSGHIDNLDLDLQHRFGLADWIEMTWGVGYRLTSDEFEGGFTISVTPNRRKAHLLSGFVHQDLSIIPDRLRFRVGAKFEHNSFTGYEHQPNARIWWSPSEGHILWGALSRAVRTPSRSEHDLRGILEALPPDSLFAGSPLALVTLRGDRKFGSESVRAVDAGYRTQVNDRFTLDVAGFYNVYDDLRTNEADIQDVEVVQDPYHLVFPVRSGNLAKGRTRGLEIATDYQVRKHWRIRAVYSYLKTDLEVDTGSLDTDTETFAGENPSHQVGIRSYMNFGERVELSLAGRYVDELISLNLPSYFTVDVNLRYELTRNTWLSVVGQNLLDTPRQEFISAASGILPAGLQRGVYGSILRAF
jgi:iron complex outermembrane receptor protein